MRIESTRGLRMLVFAGALAALAVMLVGSADGKKKHKGGGKVSVLSSQQQAILNSGAISVRVKGGKGKRVVVNGIQASGNSPLTNPSKVKPGKTVSLPLSGAGRTAMGSCSINGLQGRLLKGKKKKKKGKKSAGSPVTPLVKDLAACQSSAAEGTEVRPHRPDGLPAALAERLLHPGRREHRDRAPARSAVR